ncbi:hypothetical protein CDAR_537571 [Caerostris darwini]|uniref:Uncharacterized protein n=1 Tax=Caerostris darwini TaxID=1538125 RepID=A0AAV4QAR3_9ARAC|nr:hypothetical protein CDAR_537571 [Caerostris darwini]
MCNPYVQQGPRSNRRGPGWQESFRPQQAARFYPENVFALNLAGKYIFLISSPAGFTTCWTESKHGTGPNPLRSSPTEKEKYRLRLGVTWAVRGLLGHHPADVSNAEGRNEHLSPLSERAFPSTIRLLAVQRKIEPTSVKKISALIQFYIIGFDKPVIIICGPAVSLAAPG